MNENCGTLHLASTQFYHLPGFYPITGFLRNYLLSMTFLPFVGQSMRKHNRQAFLYHLLPEISYICLMRKWWPHTSVNQHLRRWRYPCNTEITSLTKILRHNLAENLVNDRKGDILRHRNPPIHKNPVWYPRQNNVIYLYFEYF